MRKERLAGDLTVMPMIVGSEYRDMLAVSRGAEFGPHDGDAHDALAQALLAINTQSPLFRQADGFASAIGQGRQTPGAPAVGLSWVGHWGMLYADDDPFWRQLAQVTSADRDKFMDKNWNRLPVAAEIDVTSNLRLMAFLAGARAFVEQTAPAITVWESLKYKDQPYVKVTAAERGPSTTPAAKPQEARVYYAIADGRLIVSFREDVLQRALDRSLARQAAAKPQPPARPQPPVPAAWLGKKSGRRRATAGVAPLDRHDGRRVPVRPAGPGLAQPADFERVEASLSAAGSGTIARAFLAGAAGMPRRRPLRVERPLADHGVDGVRPSGRAQSGIGIAGRRAGPQPGPLRLDLRAQRLAGRLHPATPNDRQTGRQAVK